MLDFSPLAAAAGGTPLVVLLAVLVVDLVLGFVPQMGHLHPPVPGVHRLLKGLESRLNRPNRSAANRTTRGAVVTVIVLSCAAVAGWGLWRLAVELPFGIVAEVVVLFLALSQSRVISAMGEARDGLQDGDRDVARSALRTVVPGTHAGVDDFAVARALIEAGGQGFLSRLMGPVFWYCLAGLPGIIVYAANRSLVTAFAAGGGDDEPFAFSAQSMQEALDYLPARLAALVLLSAGLFLPGASPADGVKALTRHGGSYPGRTGGWIFAPLAGVLGLALIGPKPAAGPVPAAGAWIGDGRARAGAVDIRRAIYLLAVAALIVITTVAGILLVKLSA
ncbi:MAG TPA: cobalamin biosynthesis protein [Alphaproteobacteria bacterium]|nr:cobalamin biosynthesis protein [Alphaproteobacteria bacterium]